MSTDPGLEGSVKQLMAECPDQMVWDLLYAAVRVGWIGRAELRCLQSALRSPAFGGYCVDEFSVDRDYAQPGTLKVRFLDEVYEAKLAAFIGGIERLL